MDTSSYARNSEWDLIGTSARRNVVVYECCPEPYVDITYTLHLRRRTLPYWRKVIIPSFTITLVSILSLIIPASSPTPRFLVIFFSFILLLLTIPKNLPESSLLSSFLGWSYFTMFIVLIHSIVVTAIANTLFLQSNSFINRTLRKIVHFMCCGGTDTQKQLSEDQVRYQFSRILDIQAVGVILVLGLCGMLGTLCSAPHWVVQ